MRSRNYVKLYLGTGFSSYYAEWAPISYLYEGVRLRFVTNYSSDVKVTATIVLKNGISTSVVGLYEEERYFYNKAVTFDFSSYLTQLYQQNLFRLIPIVKDDMPAHRFYLPYYKREGEETEDFPDMRIPIERIDFVVEGVNQDETLSITEPFFVIAGDNEKGDEICKLRTHLFPVNFPSVVEFMPTGEHNVITLSVDNEEEETVYEDDYPSSDNYYTLAVNLSEKFDLRYADDTRVVKFSCPNHIETQNEFSERIEAISWNISILRQFFESRTRADLFIVDTRTKGAFLRFFDRFGFVSQVLLDIVQEETNYSGDNVATASSINDFGYLHLGKENSINYRKSNSINRTTELRILHCTLERVTKDLKDDLEDLSCSPSVVMLERDNDVEYWREVSLTCKSITDNKKEDLIDFACDIMIGGRQRW